MVNLLIGTKGTGKTKRLIAKANAAVEATKGYVAVVAVGMDLNYDISSQARLINVSEYGVSGAEKFLGFIGGICAGNYDVTDIFVDTTLKILGTDCPDCLAKFIEDVAAVSERTDTNIVLSVSMDENDLPESVKKYIAE